jgi:hypothetical protein
MRLNQGRCDGQEACSTHDRDEKCTEILILKFIGVRLLEILGLYKVCLTSNVTM